MIEVALAHDKIWAHNGKAVCFLYTPINFCIEFLNPFFLASLEVYGENILDRFISFQMVLAPPP